MDTSDWIALAAVAVSIGAVVVSVVSYRGAGKRADRAAAAAERSAGAAEEAVALQRAEAERYLPNWIVEHSSGDTFRVTNDCGERCDEVQVSGPALHHEKVPRMLESGEAGTVMVHGAMGVDRTLTVTWCRPGSVERLSRTYPIPARPPSPPRFKPGLQ